MAGAILYGLTHSIRSSRRLEWACSNAIDFMWLVEGRTIDHSTFCDFRTRFQRELKGLFRQIGRVAMHMGLIRLNQVALDGTRVKANSSRHATASAKTLEKRLKVLDEQIAKMLAEADQVDQQDKDLFGDKVSGHTLPAELTDLKKRQERLRKAFSAAQQGDAKRAKSKRRTVWHDQHEAVRRKIALRLKTESGKKTYARRAHLAETPNGFIKDVLGLRQFLLRGLDKVRTEWLWACTAFNIRKLMIAMEKLRADGSLEPI